MTSKKSSVQASLSKKFVKYVSEHQNHYPDGDLFLEALNQWPEKAARANRRVTTIDDLCAVWERDVDRVPWCHDATYINFDEKIGTTPEHQNGLCYIGDPSAMLAVECVDIAPDAFVIDMCAAPGGKSVHVLNSLGRRGTLIANDIDPRRAKVLKENLERIVSLVPNTMLPHIEITTLSTQDLAEKYEGQADLVILDPPCSGEAMMRRSNTARKQWSEKLLVRMSLLQKILLAHARVMTKNGGNISYSTCTFNGMENEEVIMFGRKELGLSSHDLPHDFPIVRRETGLIIYPHRARGDGQFIALLSK